MGYVLRNGKRYYQDTNGRLILDNVSQAEADRREKRHSNDVITRRRPSTDTSHNAASITRPSTSANGRNSIPWGIVIMIAVVLVLVGAFLYNGNHVSVAEKSISDYMQSLIYGDVDEYEDEMIKSNIWPDAAERYLDANEISGYSQDEIQMMINEIYARHGREFRSEEIGGYFNSFEWYDPIPEKTDKEIVTEFNKYERANVDLLSGNL